MQGCPGTTRGHRIESHQPSGLGWFSVVYLFSTPLLFNPSGFNPLGKGLPLPLSPSHLEVFPPFSGCMSVLFVDYLALRLYFCSADGLDFGSDSGSKLARFRHQYLPQIDPKRECKFGTFSGSMIFQVSLRLGAQVGTERGPNISFR